MKLLTRQGILATCFCLLSCASVQAASDPIVDVDLKCYYQSKFDSTQDRVTGKVSILRLNGKQLVAILAKRSGIKYANGSRLKAVNGVIFVADAKGRPLGDVSKYFQLDLKNRAVLFNGKQDLTSRKELSTSYGSVSFTMNLPGLGGIVSGVLSDNLTIGGPNKFGVQYSTEASTANVNGKGQIDSKTAFFDGVMTLNGREALLNPR
jgi:hypothetical protein